MRFNDAVFGVALITFAVAVWAHSGTFPEMPGQAYGPALFPRVIAAGLFACGLILIVTGVRRRRLDALVSLGPWSREPSGVFRLSLIPLSLVGYIFLSEPLGFIPVALVLLTVLLLANGVGALRALVLAAVTTLVVHTAFYGLLRVPLPWGLLQDFAW